MNQFSRTELLIGKKAMDKLNNSKVAIFGIGGVGGFTVEALARSGVGTFDLFDKDKVSVSNINRQIIATHKTVGQFKVDVMKNRILEINPNAIVNVHKVFYTPECSNDYDFTNYSYIVDAVDTVTAKLELVKKAQIFNVPIISSMGAGNKLDPTSFEIADIYATSVCPLAKVMRKELRKRGIDKLKVVYSKEQPINPIINMNSSCNNEQKRQVPGSIAFVPSIVGLIIASEIIKDIID